MELKPKESIRVDYYECIKIEDNYSKGEIGGVIKSWSCRDLPIYNNNFIDVKSALKAVLDRNNLSYNRDWWFIWGNDNDFDYGRFDYDICVNEFDHEATEDEIKQWSNGDLKLYNLHIIVSLCIVKDFTKEYLNNIQL